MTVAVDRVSAGVQAESSQPAVVVAAAPSNVRRVTAGAADQLGGADRPVAQSLGPQCAGGRADRRGLSCLRISLAVYFRQAVGLVRAT